MSIFVIANKQNEIFFDCNEVGQSKLQVAESVFGVSMGGTRDVGMRCKSEPGERWQKGNLLPTFSCTKVRVSLVVTLLPELYHRHSLYSSEQRLCVFFEPYA